LHQQCKIMMLAYVFSAQPYWYNKARALSILAQKWQGTDPDSVQMLEPTATFFKSKGGTGKFITGKRKHENF
jgi:hypothetical protein